jgi:hypothetical protein
LVFLETAIATPCCTAPTRVISVMPIAVTGEFRSELGVVAVGIDDRQTMFIRFPLPRLETGNEARDAAVDGAACAEAGRLSPILRVPLPDLVT